MDITDIRIRRVNGEGKLKAYVTVTFDECFVIHNVKVGIKEFYVLKGRDTNREMRRGKLDPCVITENPFPLCFSFVEEQLNLALKIGLSIAIISKFKMPLSIASAFKLVVKFGEDQFE